MEQFNGTPAEKKTRLLSYRRNSKFSNYFNQSVGDDDILLCSNDTAILLKKEIDYYRGFFMSSSENDLIKSISDITGLPVVINIPTKSSPETYNCILKNSGFNLLKKYIRLYNTKIKKRGKLENIDYAERGEVNCISKLLDGNFVKFLDYLPTEKELERLVSNKNVIVNRNINNEIAGVMIFEPQGKKCYLRAWIDTSNNGLKLLFDVYTLMNLQGCNYVYFWVDSDNINVIKIHKSLSAAEDGLVDYIYLNEKLLKQYEK